MDPQENQRQFSGIHATKLSEREDRQNLKVHIEQIIYNLKKEKVLCRNPSVENTRPKQKTTRLVIRQLLQWLEE